MGAKRSLISILTTGLLAAMASELNAREALAASIPNMGETFNLAPEWNWKTIETEHFRISFPEELYETANRTAKLFEDAHTDLSPRLFWSANYKMQVLVIDNTDSANGLSAAVDRIGIVLLVTPPDNWFSTNYYDDWLRILVYHEYTHFLNMDATNSVFYKGLRYVFGDALLPNSIWPSWMLEGLAVYMETRFSKAGRGRSAYYEMILRTAAKEKALDDPEFITLDKINGTNPYYPDGETPYFFGYQLMNQAARSTPSDRDVLGRLSEASGHRLPFFINGNAENLTGKDWYTHWNDWIEDSNNRSQKQLQKIQSQPVTALERIKTSNNEHDSVTGPAVSPDGKWIAYSQESPDRRPGLYLFDTGTGESKRLMDKALGLAMAFTPDSSALIYSAGHRVSKYYFWSDLSAYDLKNNKQVWLTRSLRAKDPALSPDGRTLVFSLTENSTTGLAIASFDPEKLTLGAVEKLYWPEKFDRITTPKFSPDGKKVVFSFHPNGKTGEELIEIDVSSKKLIPVLQDGFHNRFPTFDKTGTLYFLSDRTGIDNLFRINKSGKTEQVTNVLTGLLYPALDTRSATPTIYTSEFTLRGWKLARLTPSSSPISSDKVTLDAPPAPSSEAMRPHDKAIPEYPAGSYSVYPSILPRQWYPLLLVSQSSTYFGGTVLGFDAIGRHQYLISGAYDTATKAGDWSLNYTNRSFGPNLSVAASGSTPQTVFEDDGTLYGHTRNYGVGAAISYPMHWTYSSLLPSISFNIEREFLYIPSENPSRPVGRSRLVPNIDGIVSYVNAESSQLAISAERGYVTSLGTRLYLDSGAKIWKGLFAHTSFAPLGNHVVLVPSIKGSWVSRKNSSYLSSNVVVSGRINRLMDSMPSDSFDQLALRGYPEADFLSRFAAVPSLELRYPLVRIFRGSGTNPVFLENLSGFTFLEGAVFDERFFPVNRTSANFLPSAGTGLKLTSTFFLRVPLIFSLEYHQGFKEADGGKGELFFGINLGNFSF